MQYNTNNWNSLLEDYQQHQLTADQRYELEKAALDDPFLFDALEGLALYGSAAASDREPVPGAAKSTSIFSMRNIAVAASLLALVAVVGYMQTQTTNTDRIASADTTTQPTNIDDIQGAKESTPIAMVSEPVKEEVAAVTEVQEMQDVPEVQQNTTPKPAKKVSKRVVQDGVKVSTDQRAGQQAVAGGEAVAKSKPVIKEVQTETRQTIAVSEADASQAVENTRQKLEEAAGQETAIQSNNTRIKKDLLKGQKAELSLAPAEDISAGAGSSLVSPADGWKTFEQYVRDNKKKISTLKPVAVKLSFTVGTDGDVREVTSQKTACSACEADAKTLISKSGKWSNTTGKPQQIQYIIKY